MRIPDPKGKYFGLLALFGAGGTLVCCALPIILVSIGMGSAVVALTSAIPALIVLSQYKLWVFIVSALMLIASAWATFRRDQECPADAQLIDACSSAYRLARGLFWVAASIWIFGFFSAYFLLPTTRWLNGLS